MFQKANIADCIARNPSDREITQHLWAGIIIEIDLYKALLGVPRMSFEVCLGGVNSRDKLLVKILVKVCQVEMGQGHAKQREPRVQTGMADTYCGWSVSCEASKEQETKRQEGERPQ